MVKNISSHVIQIKIRPFNGITCSNLKQLYFNKKNFIKWKFLGWSILHNNGADIWEGESRREMCNVGT
jgi:hypothetical protein